MSVLKINGEDFFCFGLENISNIIHFRKLVDIPNSKGFVVKNDDIKAWDFIGFQTIDSINYLFGPLFRGISLKEILTLRMEESLKYLSKLSSALNKVKEETKKEIYIQLDSVYFTDDGSVIFLPFEIMKNVRESSSSKYRFENYTSINHPYLTDYNSIFSVMTLLYKIFCGNFPFEGKKEDEIQSKMKNSKVIPPNLINPRLKKDISYFLEKYFNNKEEIVLNLDHVSIEIEKWTKEGFLIPENEIDNQKIEIQKEKAKEKIEKSYKNTLFLKKNMTTFISGIVFFIIAMAVLIYILVVFNKPKVTQGYSAQKVVETFYNSVNKLDDITISECVENNAGKKLSKTVNKMINQMGGKQDVTVDISNRLVDEVTSLYLTKKQSDLYQFPLRFIIVTEWIKNGKPKIENPNFLYGILNLSIKEEKGGDFPVFIVNYEKWEPYAENEISKIMKTRAYNIKERVFLINKGKYFMINRIDTLEKKVIEGSSN
jgi:hypothetical protein